MCKSYLIRVPYILFCWVHSFIYNTDLNMFVLASHRYLFISGEQLQSVKTEYSIVSKRCKRSFVWFTLSCNHSDRRNPFICRRITIWNFFDKQIDTHHPISLHCRISTIWREGSDLISFIFEAKKMMDQTDRLDQFLPLRSLWFSNGMISVSFSPIRYFFSVDTVLSIDFDRKQTCSSIGLFSDQL